MGSSSTFVGGTARLQDPSSLTASPRQLKDLQDKISSTMTRLFRKPEGGGNPFLFALAGPKPHFLATEMYGHPIDTAATNGKAFFWNPTFLGSLDENQCSTVMSHESFHVLFFHCSGERAAGKNQKDWNVSCDYIVNAVIEQDHVKTKRDQKYKLWGGPLGNPITLQNLIDWFAGKGPDLPDHGCFADPTCVGMSPETIYDQIQVAKQNSPRRCKERNGGCGAMSINPKTGQSKFEPKPSPADIANLKEGDPWGPHSCPKCGAPPDYSPYGPMDSHLPSQQTRDETLGDMMRAAEAATQMRGTVPAEVESALAELKKPQLSPRDIIRHCFQRKAIDVGNKNDWKRFKRRGMAQKPPIYQPKKHDFKPKWVAMLDTSGSMSDEDIANGLKELQLCGDNTKGYVVPCDAAPHWEGVVRITKSTDLRRTKVIGRGGTVFDQFFEELPTKLGKDFDLVVIITDGDCGHIPMNLRPNCDVLWIITNDRKFKPNFGRVCSLRPVRT
jgi:predicted metal-dependent peptidase